MACLASPRHVWIVQLDLTFHSRLHSTNPSTSQDAYRSSGERRKRSNEFSIIVPIEVPGAPRCDRPVIVEVAEIVRGDLISAREKAYVG